jgi:excisionase family DNA binding protein
MLLPHAAQHEEIYFVRSGEMPDELKELTVEQVAKELQVNPRSVYKWIQAGELGAIDLGSGGKHSYRISRSDLEDFKRRRRTDHRRLEEEDS